MAPQPAAITQALSPPPCQRLTAGLGAARGQAGDKGVSSQQPAAEAWALGATGYPEQRGESY